MWRVWISLHRYQQEQIRRCPSQWQPKGFVNQCMLSQTLITVKQHIVLNNPFMGNACDICEQQPQGQTMFTPAAQRSYTKETVVQPSPRNTMSTINKSNQTIRGDGPHLSSVTPTTTPSLSLLIQQILKSQIMRKSFQGEMVSGTKFPPFQLKTQNKCYDGEWKNGIPHGKGKAYYDDGTYFQGYFRNGVADCNDGIIIYTDGTFYRGQIKNSKSNGQGMLQQGNSDMTYTGEWLNNKPHGMGRQIYKNGGSYVGNFVEGQKSGFGTFKWADGSEYKGQFMDGNMHGNGEHKGASGQTYSGSFVMNKKQGKGRQATALGVYTGEFKNDKKNGLGEFIFSDGRIFKGGFLDGYPQGQGTMRLPNGEVINGLWRNGEIYSVQGSSQVINNGIESNPSIRYN